MNLKTDLNTPEIRSAIAELVEAYESEIDLSPDEEIEQLIDVVKRKEVALNFPKEVVHPQFGAVAFEASRKWIFFTVEPTWDNDNQEWATWGEYVCTDMDVGIENAPIQPYDSLVKL